MNVNVYTGSSMWSIHKEFLLNNVFICWCIPVFVFMMLLGRVLFLDSDKMPSEGMLENITFSANRNRSKEMIQYISMSFCCGSESEAKCCKILANFDGGGGCKFKNTAAAVSFQNRWHLWWWDWNPAPSLPRAEVRNWNYSLLFFHYSAAAINHDLWNIFPTNQPIRLLQPKTSDNPAWNQAEL